MKLIRSFVVFLLFVVLNAFSVQPAVAQTRLGLHVTQEELNIWKQRAQSGPYRVAGDVSTNSPGDWSRIQSNANSFLSNPSAEVWSGQPSGSCWSHSGSPALPGRSRGEKLRDAGFVYLITGNTTYRDTVRTTLLNQAATPGTNWNDATRWKFGAGCTTGDSHNHEIAMWLTKIIFGYDYIRHSLSGSDQTTLDNWFRDAGLFFEQPVHNIAQIRFPNRKSNNYTTYNTAYDPVGNDGSPARVTHFGGWTKTGWMEGWSNRTAVHARYMAVAGVLTNNTFLKTEAKRWVKEAIKYATFPDGTYMDFHRWESTHPALGWGYAAAVHTMGVIADLLARSGDMELYNFSTSEGKYGTQGGPKTLYQMMKQHLEYVNRVIARYGTDQSANNGNPNYRIGPIDLLANEARNHDTYFAPMNVFFKDNYLRSIYMRMASGAPAYPSNPAGGGFCVWCGEQGVFPGVLFMFGQMEGKVWPYPASSGTSPNQGTAPFSPSNIAVSTQ